MSIVDWFKKSNQGLIGIDIGSSAVKVAELKKRGKSWKVLALGKKSLPEDTIVDGSIIAKLPLAEAIEEIFQQQKIKSDQIATSISGHSVIVKKVTLPALNEKELAQSIEWEAEQYIPFDLAEVNVDYQVLRRNPDENELQIILVAAKKDKIADYTSVISIAGKTPSLVDIDAFALQNIYEINYQPEENHIAALLDIGAGSTNVNIVRGTEFLFTRDIAIGGAQYTEMIQEEFGLDHEEAEKYKKDEDVPPPQKEEVRRILNSTSENLLMEIEKTFDYFKTTTQAEEIEHLLVTGGASKTAGLLGYLADHFEFPVERLDPFQRVDAGDFAEDDSSLEDLGPDYAIALGLGLRTEA